MRNLNFDLDNNNIFSVNTDLKMDFSHHINTFSYPLFHGHDDYWEFTVLTDGNITNRINGRDEEYQPITLFFACPGDMHQITSNTNGVSIRYINVIVRESKVDELMNVFSPTFKKQLKEGPRAYDFPDSKKRELDNIFHKINSLDSNEHDKYSNYMLAATMLIFQFLFTKVIDINNNEDYWVQALNNKMKSMDFLKYNVEQLCQELGCSRMHLNRFIKNQYDQTPHQFLLSYKLSYAKSLLLSTDMSLQHIIETVGYDSFSSFCKNFKEKYGVTPYQFRLRKNA